MILELLNFDTNFTEFFVMYFIMKNNKKNDLKIRVCPHPLGPLNPLKTIYSTDAKGNDHKIIIFSFCFILKDILGF